MKGLRLASKPDSATPCHTRACITLCTQSSPAAHLLSASRTRSPQTRRLQGPRCWPVPAVATAFCAPVAAAQAVPTGSMPAPGEAAPARVAVLGAGGFVRDAWVPALKAAVADGVLTVAACWSRSSESCWAVLPDLQGKPFRACASGAAAARRMQHSSACTQPPLPAWVDTAQAGRPACLLCVVLAARIAPFCEPAQFTAPRAAHASQHACDKVCAHQACWTPPPPAPPQPCPPAAPPSTAMAGCTPC